MRPILGLTVLLALVSPTLLLSGCATSFDPDPTTIPTQTSLKGISGNVHGGRQPVSGAHLYVYAAGAGGYGGNGIAASTANASTSLLTSFPTGSFPTAKDAANNYYVTTDINGNFALTGEYTCTSGTQVYLYAVGGQPSPSTTNSAAAFLAVLGQCPATGTMAAITPTVMLNEVSTVAAAFAFAGFATDALHVSGSGTTLATQGIKNAFANTGNLYDVTGGHGPIALAKTPGGNGAVPQTTIDAIANAIAACVNSTGSASTQCSTLFSDTRVDGTTTGTQPADTASAAINIAHYPATNVAAIFNLTTGIGTPYVPTLGSAPSDFTLGITFTGGGMNSPAGIAIDAFGNAWTANNGANFVTQVSPTAAVSSFALGGTNFPYGLAIDASNHIWTANEPVVAELNNDGSTVSTGYTTGLGSSGPFLAVDGPGASSNIWVPDDALHGTHIAKLTSSGSPTVYSVPTMNGDNGVAVDGGGNIWVSNANGNSISRLNSAGVSTNTYTGGSLAGPAGVAIDSSGNAWIANDNANNGTTITKITQSGTLTSYSGGGLATPDGIAIDGAGNVWTANVHGTSVSEFSPFGTALSPTAGFTGGAPSVPTGIAIDGSGNVWTADLGNNALTEIIGAAVPVITPICSGLPASPNSNGTSNLGTRP